jgi:hypothetical protein
LRIENCKRRIQTGKPDAKSSANLLGGKQTKYSRNAPESNRPADSSARAKLRTVLTHRVRLISIDDGRFFAAEIAPAPANSGGHTIQTSGVAANRDLRTDFPVHREKSPFAATRHKTA